MLDVGANVGLYSLLAASIGGVRVKAFEPDDGARRIAEANVARNGLGGLVEISAHAVGAAAGSSAFSTGLGPMNRLMPEGTAGGVRTVDLVTLDDVATDRVALVKIDVEGEEAGVLDGAEQLLRRDRPVVIVEANDPPALTERLTSLGYRWAAYDPAGRQVTVADGPPAKGANGIAVADFEALQDRLSSP
jgi:FkbM family methyltransferase